MILVLLIEKAYPILERVNELYIFNIFRIISFYMYLSLYVAFEILYFPAH